LAGNGVLVGFPPPSTFGAAGYQSNNQKSKNFKLSINKNPNVFS